MFFVGLVSSEFSLNHVPNFVTKCPVVEKGRSATTLIVGSSVILRHSMTDYCYISRSAGQNRYFVVANLATTSHIQTIRHDFLEV